MPTAGARSISGVNTLKSRLGQRREPQAALTQKAIRQSNMLSDSDFAMLNAIYLKKMATPETIADVTGLSLDTVNQRMAGAVEHEWIIVLPTGAMLLAEGTKEVLGYYRVRYAQDRLNAAVVKWYENFEALNARFIGLVTEWQQSDGDERVERRLLQSAEKLARDIGQLVPRIARYQAYVRRFERSMDLVDRGQRDFVCKPTIDSVHNIWFEFHEDILAVLGRPRDTT
jgi:hypothetical protein